MPLVSRRRRDPRPPGRVGAFLRRRWDSLYAALAQAPNEEKVRAVLALALVGILIALQFFPSGDQELTTATETLAISVVAFYFGLHMTTNGRTAGNDRGQGPPRRRRNPPDLAEPF